MATGAQAMRAARRRTNEPRCLRLVGTGRCTTRYARQALDRPLMRIATG